MPKHELVTICLVVVSVLCALGFVYNVNLEAAQVPTPTSVPCSVFDDIVARELAEAEARLKAELPK